MTELGVVFYTLQIPGPEVRSAVHTQHKGTRFSFSLHILVPALGSETCTESSPQHLLRESNMRTRTLLRRAAMGIE